MTAQEQDPQAPEAEPLYDSEAVLEPGYPSSPETPERIPEEPAAQSLVTVTALELNVRERPAGRVLRTVRQGAQLEVLSQEDGWLQTPIGYVLQEHTS